MDDFLNSAPFNPESSLALDQRKEQLRPVPAVVTLVLSKYDEAPYLHRSVLNKKKKNQEE